MSLLGAMCNKAKIPEETGYERAAILGWIAVGISTTISCLWAFWGAYESFHEGWYFKSLTENLVCTAKYLTLMVIFLVLSVIPLRWPRVGGSLYELFSIGFWIWILMTRKVLNLGVVLGWLPVILPPVLLGILFWVGRPKTREPCVQDQHSSSFSSGGRICSRAGHAHCGPYRRWQPWPKDCPGKRREADLGAGRPRLAQPGSQ